MLVQRSLRRRKIASALSVTLLVGFSASACGGVGAAEGRKAAQAGRSDAVDALWRTYYGGFKGQFSDLLFSGRFVACRNGSDPGGVKYAAVYDYDARNDKQTSASFANDVNRALRRAGWRVKGKSNSSAKLKNDVTGHVYYLKGAGGNLTFVTKCIDAGKATSEILAHYGDDSGESLEPSASTPSPVPTGFSPQP